MGEEVRDPRSLLPLTPAVLHILLALADGERHGYGIMREVEGRTRRERKSSSAGRDRIRFPRGRDAGYGAEPGTVYRIRACRVVGPHALRSGRVRRKEQNYAAEALNTFGAHRWASDSLGRYQSWLGRYGDFGPGCVGQLWIAGCDPSGAAVAMGARCGSVASGTKHRFR